jgi:biopolymer transport protein ExbD
MAMKKRSKVSAEFSMSSLTDIIFLLLIFFMLTSSMVQINMELAQSDSKTVAATDLTVMMYVDGKVTFNGKKTSTSQLTNVIKSEYSKMDNKDNASVSIVAEVGIPWKKINEIIVIANQLKMRANILTQPVKD